ncbi:MAG: T9SS type A sorting domain-containing protein [Bacteroidales bacterium]|jgi:hypothetical protein
MKKIIFAVLAIICSLTAIGQQEQRPQYFDDYLFPRYMASGCYDTTYDFIHHTDGVSAVFNVSFAQPFFIDSAISIKGIGAFVNLEQPYLMNLQNPAYLQIRDASLNNILAQIRYDTLFNKEYVFDNNNPLTTRVEYIEELFDSTVYISDTIFYVTITFPAYYPSYPSSFRTAYGYFADCNNGDFPILVQVKDSNNWISYFDFEEELNGGIQDSMQISYELLVFPILGTVASSGGLNQVRVDKDISIYPNPARDEINIVSSFKMNNIIVYNTLGQKVIEEIINGNTTQLDVSKFAKGNYIAKIYTDNGVATKKFIVE